MDPALELLASQAVRAARLFGRAVHDPEGWQIKVDGLDLVVTPTLSRTPTAILLEAEIRFECEAPVILLLLHHGEMVSVKDLEVIGYPGDRVQVRWTLGTVVSSTV